MKLGPCGGAPRTAATHGYSSRKAIWRVSRGGCWRGGTDGVLAAPGRTDRSGPRGSKSRLRSCATTTAQLSVVLCTLCRQGRGLGNAGRESSLDLDGSRLTSSRRLACVRTECRNALRGAKTGRMTLDYSAVVADGPVGERRRRTTNGSASTLPSPGGQANGLYARGRSVP